MTLELHVLDRSDVPPPELTFPSTRTIEIGDSTVLTASGGVDGYDYWLEGPGWWNQFLLPDRKVRYRAPESVSAGFPITVLLYVKDGLGRQKVAAITVVEDD